VQYFLTYLFFVTLSCSALARTRGYKIENVDVFCSGAKRCGSIRETSKNLIRENVTKKEIERHIEFILKDDDIQSVDYKVLKRGVVEVLNIHVTFFMKINTAELIVDGSDISLNLKQFLTLQKGSRFSETILEDEKKQIAEKMKRRGMEDVEVVSDLSLTPDGADIVFRVNVGVVKKVESVQVNSKSKILRQRLRKRFNRYLNTSFDPVEFKVDLDSFKIEVFNEGYYFSRIDDVVKPLGRGGVSLELGGDLGTKTHYHYTGNLRFSREELNSLIKKAYRSFVGEAIPGKIVDVLKEHYKLHGIYGTEVETREVHGVNIHGASYVNYYVKIKEGRKIRVGKVVVTGNRFFTKDKIKAIFIEQATDLASGGYLDVSYLESFKDVLSEEYLKNGFVKNEIDDPVYKINFDKSEAEILLRIREGEKAVLSEIKTNNIDESLREKILKNLDNKIGSGINLTKLKSDLLKSLTIVRDEGFYYAKIKNVDENNILRYSDDFEKVTLTMDFFVEKKTMFNELLVTGLDKTHKKVIEREFDLKKGDFVTPKELKELKERLSSLGIFSFIRVTPFVVNRLENEKNFKTNILIQLTEKNFGNYEVALGYWGDLGLKASSTVAYNNVFWDNQSLSLGIQANRRFSHRYLDARRRSEQKNVIEWQAKLGYTVPYLAFDLMGTPITFDFNTSYQVKRFFGFDATIIDLTPQLSWEVNKHFSLTLKYSLETIKQSDATEEKDNDRFRIGSLTPGFSLDFRDNAIQPRKGVYWGLNWEFANDTFNSMKNDDIHVNFSKLISRHKFYIPFGQKWTMAMSLSWGGQKNFANQIKKDSSGNIIYDDDGRAETDGYIPSIKVFRLDGVDSVRGFADDEINRLIDGNDIGSVVIDDSAYFVNAKLEPRYYYNDNLALGIYLDAGRVYRNHFTPSNLRTSSGVSLKVLTPVGSLDFDYGVKHHRKTHDVSKRESLGRFHLSVGFF